MREDEAHSSEVPEFLALRPEEVGMRYLDWLRSATKAPRGTME